MGSNSLAPLLWANLSLISLATVPLSSVFRVKRMFLLRERKSNSLFLKELIALVALFKRVTRVIPSFSKREKSDSLFLKG